MRKAAFKAALWVFAEYIQPIYLFRQVEEHIFGEGEQSGMNV